MSIGSLSSASPRAGATPTTGNAAIEPSGPVAVKLENTLVSSLVSADWHGDLLGSLGEPPATWDLRQGGAG